LNHLVFSEYVRPLLEVEVSTAVLGNKERWSAGNSFKFRGGCRLSRQ